MAGYYIYISNSDLIREWNQKALNLSEFVKLR